MTKAQLTDLAAKSEMQLTEARHQHRTLKHQILDDIYSTDIRAKHCDGNWAIATFGNATQKNLIALINKHIDSARALNNALQYELARVS